MTHKKSIQATVLDKQSPHNLKSGKYIVGSDDQRYWQFLSMPNAMLIGQTMAEDGKNTVNIFEVKSNNKLNTVSNPSDDPVTMSIDPSFFQSAKKEYQQWKDKWWREAFQNSVDAGATDIVCQIAKQEKDGDSKWIVSCEDNGSGMTREILFNKFLALGASGKTGEEGKTGGFGKAKELLLLPWISWIIWTGDIFVKGKGNQYKEEKAPYHRKGTALIVIMGNGFDDHTDEVNAINVISRSYLPQVKFTVNKKVFYANLKGSKTVLQPDDKRIELYVADKDENHRDLSSQGLVRVNGLYMHSFYTQDIESIPIIEVIGPSIEILSVSRDSFREYTVSSSANKVIYKIQMDKQSALKKQENLFVRKYKGIKNKSQLRSDKLSDITDKLGYSGKQSTVISKTGISFSDNAIDSISKSVEIMSELSNNTETLLGSVSGESAKAMLELELGSITDIDSAISRLIWTPDFYIENEIPRFYIDPKFYPETMKSRPYMLAKAWSELVRFVLIQLGCDKDYTIGWIFSKDTMASYKYDDDNDHLILINPYKIINGNISSDEYSHANEDDIQLMYSMAIHECTHMVDNLSSHDEAFAYALTRNFAKCTKGVKKLQRIIKGIKKFKDRD